MAISLHVLYDELENDGIDRCYNWLRDYRPRWVNITAAARFAQAVAFALKVQRELGIQVIMRNSGAKGGGKDTDDGIHSRMSPEDWFAAHAAWAEGTGLTIMTDNESVRDDMDVYAKWMAKVMRLAAAKGIRLAVGRTATGNPAEHHYAMMDEMWIAIAEGNHVYSPNEYFDVTPQKSGGNIARYKLAWERCKFLGLPIPETVIGEYGLLVGYDPEYGYKRTGLPAHPYAQLCIYYDKVWYQPEGVTVCVYAFCGNIGKWKDTNVDDENWLNRIKEYKPVATTPPEAGQDVTLDYAMGLNIRTGAGTSFKALAPAIANGDHLVIYPNTMRGVSFSGVFCLSKARKKQENDGVGNSMRGTCFQYMNSRCD